MNRREFLIATALGVAGCQTAHPQNTAPNATLGRIRGRLRVRRDNPRYFTDDTGRAVYLTGAHTWPNLVDQGLTNPPKAFDYEAYLARLTAQDHNFIRLWTWESTVCDIDEGGRRMRYFAAQQPWPRTGPGLALDGQPKFDLSRFNPDYFERLRQRVKAAHDRGLYVSVMLFEGWAMQHAQGAWEGHPFHPRNNLQEVNGDANGDGRGLDIFTLGCPATLRLQEAYVRHVLDTVSRFDNVLYEISNENHPPSTEWQYHLIRFIQEEEGQRGRAHPVGMTFQYKGGRNQTLFDSPADWISPNPDGGYRDDPPAADGRKVILTDTDHLWGIGGSAEWVWKSFLRGMNPLFMDPYDGVTFGAGDSAKWEPIRVALGRTRRLADRLPLRVMTPQPGLASTRYCLAAPPSREAELLIYLPKGGAVTVDLAAYTGTYAVRWHGGEHLGQETSAAPAQGGTSVALSAPL
jgi:hypothetical protein